MHGDHICGLNKMKANFPDAKVYIGEEERDFLYNNNLNLAPYIIGREFKYEEVLKL